MSAQVIRIQCKTPPGGLPTISGILCVMLMLGSSREAASTQSLAASKGPVVDIHHAQGEMAGEVTATSVLLQTRLTAIAGPELDAYGDVPGVDGTACFEFDTTADFRNVQRTKWQTAEAASDSIIRSTVAGLNPATQYFYRLVYGPNRVDVMRGEVRRFKTLPAPESDATVSFCMGSCMNYYSFMSGVANGGGPVTATEEDKRLGYPSFAAMRQLNPDFFIGTGDIVYYDHPAKKAAQTLPELHRKWHEQFRLPRLVQFFGQTPAYWSKDDHDFRFNDADLRGQKLPDAVTGIQLFRQQMPIVSSNDDQTPTYRTHRVNKHVQLWFVEGRDFRSPNRDPDGPDKSIWGVDQKRWLKATLKESDATWKIIVTPTPMVGPDSARKTDNHTNPGGFRHEADEFFAWLNTESITNVITFCGDRHWQYHSIHPLGVEEFCCGALNDENSILGSRPGAKNSTDPEGKIRQPYVYSEPTGGFLYVTIQVDDKRKPRLSIQHMDDHGMVLNKVEKSHP